MGSRPSGVAKLATPLVPLQAWKRGGSGGIGTPASEREESIMTRMKMRAGTWALAAAMTFLGCDATPPTVPPVEAPSYAISDGAHGGLPHFFFLPPMVPPPPFTGVFDATLEPVVEICALTGSDCGD